MKTNINIYKVFLLTISTLFFSCRKEEYVVPPVRDHLMDSRISLSPDNQSIAFAYAINSVQAIYTADTNGNNIKKLTDPLNAEHTDVKYSPDGKKILFLSHSLAPINEKKKENPSIRYLCIMNADGSNLQQLTFDNAMISNPAFSDEGSKIYFIRSEFNGSYHPMTGTTQHNFDICAIDIDGRNYHNVTNIHGDTPSTMDPYYSYVSKPEISSDGFYKLFIQAVSTPQVYSYELFAKDTRTQQETQITRSVRGIASPHFLSNDRIVFLENVNLNYNAPDDYQLRMINVDGSNLKKIIINI